MFVLFLKEYMYASFCHIYRGWWVGSAERDVTPKLNLWYEFFQLLLSCRQINLASVVYKKYE